VREGEWCRMTGRNGNVKKTREIGAFEERSCLA
jgi:hypothetical protein